MPHGGYSLDQPRTTDPNAYVAGGILVAHFEEAFVSTGLSLSPSSLYPVKKAIVAGPLLEMSDGRWELPHFELDARLQISDALWVMSRFPDVAHPDQPLCKNLTEYQQLKDRVCSFLDIASTDDSSNAHCDAVSHSQVMEAKQARLGDILPTPGPAPPSCPVDIPEGDTCD
jgi:hypothetical protein